MTGQDAVGVAEAFHATLEIDGVILSKLDGDARGGAALSVKEVIGRPIAFASVGEKLADFEAFHPDRMASRILGMGDVLTLIEKAEEAYDQDEAVKAAEKLQTGPLHARGFPRADAADQEDGAPPEHRGYDSGDSEGVEEGRDRRTRARPGGSDHPVDDPRGAPRPSDHQRLAAAAGGERQRHHDQQRSTSCSSSSRRCRR